jgi:guanylate kinase
MTDDRSIGKYAWKEYPTKNLHLQQKIDHLTSIVNFPLIVMMWAPWVWKDTILNALVKIYPDAKKIKRATTRPRKTRDIDNDFDFLTPERFAALRDQWEILFDYESHRLSEKWSQNGYLYSELLWLENHICFTVLWKWWLDHLSQFPISVISILIHWDEEFVVSNLSKNRVLTEWDFQENIDQVKSNLTDLMNSSQETDLVVQNVAWSLQETIVKIHHLIEECRSGILSERSYEMLAPIRRSLMWIMDKSLSRKDLETAIYHTLVDEEWNVDPNKLHLLVQSMYFSKKNNLPNLMQTYSRMWHRESKTTSKELRKEYYIAVARVVYHLWHKQEAHDVLLQVWIQDNSVFKEVIAPIEYQYTLEDIMTENEITSLKGKGLVETKNNTYHSLIDRTLNIYEYALFWRNLYSIAQSWNAMLSNTAQVEILETTGVSRWTILARVDGHPDISYIKIHVIKDRP